MRRPGLLMLIAVACWVACQLACAPVVRLAPLTPAAAWTSLVRAGIAMQGTPLARACFSLACTAGDVEGCRWEAVVMARTDPAQATPLFALACDGGDAIACRGVHRLRRGCELGDGGSCWTLATARSTSTKVTQIDDTQRALLDRGCELGDPQACSLRGAIDFRMPLYDAIEEARAMARRACQDGDLEACVVATMPYTDGASGPLLERACAGGVPAACTRAADGATNEDTRTSFLARACAIGDKSTCYVVARRLGHDAAIALLAPLCDGGDRTACTEVATFFATGDPQRDVYREKACRLGDGATCVNLAAALGQPSAAARELYELACAAGVECATAGALEFTGNGPDADAQAFTNLRRGCTSPNGCVDAAIAAEERGDPIVAAAQVRGCVPGTAGCETLARILGDIPTLPTANEVAALGPRCDAGAIDACARLGLAFEYGAGVTGSWANATALFRRACEANDGESCWRLASLLFGSTATRLAPLFDDKACSLGERRGCIAQLPRTRPNPLLRAACHTGLATACNPGDADDHDALDWLCRTNDAMACWILARRDGDTLSEHRACLANPMFGCREEADQLVADPALAKKLLAAGCGSGDAQACGELINRLDDPTGDEAKALQARRCLLVGCP